MSIKALLSKTGLFSQLSTEEFDELLSSVLQITVPDNTIFIKKGDSADALYVIEAGVCQVFTQAENGHEIIVARLEPGAYFGEQALLTETPGKRNASVRSISEMKLLKIPHAFFQKALSQDEALKKKLQQVGRQQLQTNIVLENAYKIYSSRTRGEIRQYHGSFLDQPAIITSFLLKNGREVFVARVADKNIQTIRDESAKPTQNVIFSNDTLHRELLLEEDRLVGVTVYGEWSDLSQIINMIFNATPLDESQLANFSATGEIVLVLPEAPTIAVKNDDEIICNCMFISLGQIKEQINAGALDVEAIGDATGAGTVCGTCRAQMQDLLGHGNWQAVRIKKRIPLTPYIHAYQIVSAMGENLSAFEAGQFIVMQCFIEGNWVNRSYTITSRASYNEYYEIAIQCEEGGTFSTWLFRHENETPLLRISQPDGKFTPDFSLKEPMICLMAGIGITPGVAFARAAFDKKSQRPLHIYFSAHTENDFAYLSELRKLEALQSSIKVSTRETQKEGRLQEKDLAELIAKFPNADYFICGPNDFETSMQGYLKSLKVSENRIFIEKFTHSYDPV